MIDRVEILKDGASAVYGADAVAGVVNIITKQNFDGIQLDVQTADWFDSKGANNTVAMIAGRDFDGGNFLFGVEYVDQEEAYQSDTQWDFFQDSWFIYPGGCENQVTAPYDGTPQGGCYPVGSSRIPESRLNLASIGQRFYDAGTPDETPRLFDWFNGELNGPLDDPNPDFDPTYGVPTFNNPTTLMNEDGSGLVAYDGRTYNYAPVNYIQTPYERVNLFAQASMDLGNEMTLSGEIRANRRSSAQELAPQPYNSPTDPAYQGVFTPTDPITGNPLLEAPVVNADGDTVFVYTADPNAPGAREVVTSYSGISPDNFYNTLGVPIRDARRRMVETTRRFEQEINQIQANATLAGSFNEVDWEVYYNKGYRNRQDTDFGQFFGPALRNAMGPSADLNNDGTPECYADINDPATLIAGCVPFNFFGGPFSVTQDMIDYVSVDLNDSFESILDQGGIALTGSAFELPGGEMGWAFGYEYRKEEFKFNPDATKQKDEVTGNTGAGTRGQYSVDSLYVEFFAPFFDNGSQALDLTVGARYDDFSTFGDNSTWQAGLEFQVFEDLKVRATAGEVFRAPGIGELFAGQVDSFPTYNDPCDPTNNVGGVLAPGCTATAVQLDTQVLARVGGNPNLQPEQGDTLTAGIVWTPTFGDHDISVTVDYWQTELEDLVTNLGVQYILNDCYQDLNQNSCALVTRRADYSIAQILDAPLNAALAEAEGVDTEIRWSFETGVGEFETAVLWAHYLTLDRQAFPGDDPFDAVGRYTGAAFAQDKINYSFGWFRNDMSIRYLGEYISDLTSTGVSFISSYDQKIDAQLYHDLIFGYDIRDTGTRISAGITNVADEAPPYIDLGFNASTDPSTYRLFGRGYYLRIQQSFE